jgi:hypothetical protein
MQSSVTYYDKVITFLLYFTAIITLLAAVIYMLLAPDSHCGSHFEEPALRISPYRQFFMIIKILLHLNYLYNLRFHYSIKILPTIHT